MPLLEGNYNNNNNLFVIIIQLTPQRWFEVETNYDHWEQPPWIDNRIDPANKLMTAIGQNGVTLEKMFQVNITTIPVA